MHTEYNPAEAEPKWQKKWEEDAVYRVNLDEAEDPYYSMVMFPYPSGDRLHVGHWYNFAPADSFSRYMKMQGKDVFTPMGFDAFGLPAENYAIKTGIHPSESIAANVETMITQLKRIGCMYDWEKMVNTSKPAYYRWTQWLFIQMFENGLAFKKDANVNWCDSCQTVLANEQAQDGSCERCGTVVEQKPMTQWYWRITDYAQRLLDNHEKLDWPDKTITMQKNWIGRKEGVFIQSNIKGIDYAFEVWDSVPQTFMAQTFTVIAPEHKDLPMLMKGRPEEKEVLALAEKIKRKKMCKEFNPEEDMEGIFTGLYVDDPFGHGDLPLWVASYVVADYGSGIVHCSAHDERDFAFAKKFDIPLRPVMFPEDPEKAEQVRNLEWCFAKDPDGIMEQPEKFKGRKWGEVRQDIIKYMTEDMKVARAQVNYKLRDWSISRQRYWGAPIPIVYDPDGNPHTIPEEHLPWELPTDVEFKPTGTSPLAQSRELIERTEKIFGKGWRPEVDTMDTFVCSSFYQLMYLGDHCGKEHSKSECHPEPDEGANCTLVDKGREKKWMPADMYIGGPEHACMHLIYARFVTMALKDFGHIENDEPFQRLVHQGLITHGGAKMSKSKGNVVSPDAFIERSGSDVFRMYLMFMGPFTDGGDWSDTGIKGVERFVQRIWKLVQLKVCDSEESKKAVAKLHWAIQKVTKDIEKLHFNTALAALMELLNVLEKEEGISKETATTFAKLLAPMAPHLAEELWSVLGNDGYIIHESWPTYDESLLVTDTVTIAIQVAGKLRGTIDIAPELPQEEVIALAKQEQNVAKFLEGQTLKKEIYIPSKLVSFVV